MSPPPTATAARPNQREHILDVALGLIASNGASGMSMRMLAKDCGLNVAAIYHYFDSKDALVAAVVDERQYGARLAEIPEIDPSLPAPDRLERMFREIWEGALAEEPVWRVLLGEGLRGEAMVLPVGKDLLDVIGPGLTEWLKIALPEASEPEAVAQMLIGQLFAGFLRHIFEPDLDTEIIRRQATVALTAVVLG
ncbi:MAG TPA: TetR/AcrR family transcriptional regulator [Microthrixaceae bacterium]|nr:TetR/AcrR family transcriptional regulator [Microthrixaceae bacterium]